MAGVWHYTTLLDAIDHWQTLLGAIIALVSAILAVVVTIRFEARHLREHEKDLLTREIQFSNKGMLLVFNVTNDVLSAKKQYIKPMKGAYDEARQKTMQALEQAAKHRKQIALETQIDGRQLSVLTLSTELIENIIIKELSSGRSVILLSNMITSIHALNSFILKRNQLLNDYKSSKLPPDAMTNVYFGFEMENVTDMEYANVMQGIYEKSDDTIFFSSQIVDTIHTYASGLASTYKRKFGHGAPIITKANWSIAKNSGLWPDEAKYADFMQMFAKQEETKKSRLAIFVSWFGRLRPKP